MSKERNGLYRGISRSRSPSVRSYSRSKTRSRTRTRSRSLSRGRKYSRSPSYRRRHSPPRRRTDGGSYSGSGIFDAQRLDPPPSSVLGVFGLSTHTTERDLKDYFGKYGKITQIRLIIDKRTNKSRGFGFVYYDKVEDAKEAKRKCHGIEIDGKNIRVDFSIGERDYSQLPPSRPPPYRRHYSPYGGRGRSPPYRNERDSPTYRPRYSRSRSRSYDRRYRRSTSYKR